jgi:Ca-activated chloride channel homolog
MAAGARRLGLTLHPPLRFVVTFVGTRFPMTRICANPRGSSGGERAFDARPGGLRQFHVFRGASPLLRLLCACFVLALLSATAGAQMREEVHIRPRPQTPTPTPQETEVNPALRTHTRPMMVDVDLVLVNVTVTDPMNRLVTGLEKENFQLYEERQPQQVQHFSSEDAPLSMGVIFDISGSMSDKIDKAREAVVEFFKTAGPEDEFFVITFADRPELLADFTTSIEDIQSTLVFAMPGGRTAMLDAIYMGITHMRNAHHSKKALLVISDGGDNRSRYTQREIRNMVREADVQVYGIGIFDPFPRSDEERRGPMMMAEITDVTGGRTFTITNPNELADVATKIGIELRNQYVLGYRPINPVRDGKWRRIRVRLNPPKGLPPLQVYSKTGYYAPTE